MTRSLRYAATVAALLGGVAVAGAQTAGTGTTGAGLDLTPPQRTTIYQTVMKDKARTRSPGSVRVSVGVELPASIELYVLPDSVGSEMPATKLYKYTVIDDQVVIVDPTQMRVVDIIHR